MAVPGSQARVTPTPVDRLEGQRCIAAHCDFYVTTEICRGPLSNQDVDLGGKEDGQGAMGE